MDANQLSAQLMNIEHDLLENVRHAFNIQSVIQPDENMFRVMFPESFIIYKPHSVVSGDFYWMGNIDSKLSLLLGDSTGHGVSASYISIMVLSAIEIMLKQSRTDISPEKVLEYLNDHLFSILKKNKGSQINETAELACLTLDVQNMKISYASAGIYIFSYKNGEITALHRNKISVGEYNKGEFVTDKIDYQLTENERIFIMTDGLRDQIGGSKDKRLGTRRVMELLKVTSGLSLPIQNFVINEFIDNWKKTNYQTDDISLIAFGVPSRKS